MLTISDVAALALALPEATVSDHHGMDSFRIRGKIFATVPDDHHVRIMLGPADIEATVAECPDACAPFYWGNRLACVVVAVAVADSDVVRELLTDAWRRKAPKRLVAQLG